MLSMSENVMVQAIPKKGLRGVGPCRWATQEADGPPKGGRSARSLTPKEQPHKKCQDLLVSLGEGVRLDQLGRFRHHLEGAVRHALGDARLAPQVMVGVHLHVAFG